MTRTNLSEAGQDNNTDMNWQFQVNERRQKMTRTNLLMGLAIVVMASQCGCGPKRPVTTGFLSDYSRLEAVSDTMLQHVVPANEFRSYRSFIVDPVAVHFHGNAKGTDAKSKEIAELGQYMHSAFQNALLDHYNVVRRPGPGVARIRKALTDLEKSSPALNVIPQTKLAGVGLGGASMEGEVLDSVTGKQLAAVVQVQKGKKLSLSGLTKYGDAKAVMDDWAQRLVQKLDEANKPF